MQYFFFLCCDVQIHLLVVWPCIFRSPYFCIFWRTNNEFLCTLCHVGRGPHEYANSGLHSCLYVRRLFAPFRYKPGVITIRVTHVICAARADCS